MTADEILQLTSHDLVAKFAANSGKQISTMMKSWHPDICDHARSNDVFRHLVALRDGLHSTKPTRIAKRVLKMADGRKLGISPLSTVQADQGEIIVNRNTVATLFPPEFGNLAIKETRVIENFRFANSKMERQMAYSLPKLLHSEVLADGSIMVIVRKEPQDILLSDLLRTEGRMPDVHAAWLCSGLMNIAAWLSYTGLVHGAISPEHILIDPSTHIVRLVAGWAFTTAVDERPDVLPSRTLKLAPRLSKRGQTVATVNDRELIRQVIRETLDDPYGTSGAIASLPARLGAWINLPPAIDATVDYNQWQLALEDGWGTRRFVKYQMQASDIYDNI